MAQESTAGTARQFYIQNQGVTTGPHPGSWIVRALETGLVPHSAMLWTGTAWMTTQQFLSMMAVSPPLPAPGGATALRQPSNGPLPLADPSDGSADDALELSDADFATSPAGGHATPAAGMPAVTPQDDGDDAPLERDCIVVLGRRQSGKTIYLASLYAKLWQAPDGLSAKALSGEVHKHLMTVHRMLREGDWPPSTLGTSQIELEIEYHGRKRLLVALDFAGELFAKAFVEERTDWPGVKELVNHIDRAAAVIMLVDPSVVVGTDKQAAMEDDFGLVQAVGRIRNWPSGEHVPIVLVLTKMDQHQQLIDRAGGPMQFVRQRFPALMRFLKEIPIEQVSAVQIERDANGKAKPRRDSRVINVDAPLRFCLRKIERGEDRAQRERGEQDRRMIESQQARAREQQERRQKFAVASSLAGICLVGTTLVFLILFFNV